jgi:hypothetical protein
MALPPVILQKRLDGLEKNMGVGVDLLNELENAIQMIDRPTEKKRYKQDVEQIQGLVDQWSVEWTKLSGEVQAQPAAPAALTEQLNRIEQKLGTIQQGVETAKAEILAEVRITREVLLSKYDESQRELLAQIIKELDQDQIETLDAINTKLEDKALKGSVVEADYKEITEALTVIEQAPEVKPEVKQEIAKIKEAAEAEKSDNGVKSGLKLALPLIPGLLDISADTANLKQAAVSVNLGVLKGEVKISDAVNKLKDVWHRFKDRAKQPAAS